MATTANIADTKLRSAQRIATPPLLLRLDTETALPARLHVSHDSPCGFRAEQGSAVF